MAEEQESARTLSKTTFKAFCRQLEKAIRSENASASFACGGTIPIKGTKATEQTKSTQEAKAQANGVAQLSDPINIFWDCKDATGGGKLTLPLDCSSDDSNAKLHRFVAECEPAGFGRGQEAVMDPSYRRAGKLDTDHFMTSFYPSDFGIVERIQQVLTPDAVDDERQEFRRIRMELYKLNVYSGPSGLFQSHVDTPRSESQIGSLVVCLPSPFKGGNLMVRHEGREVDFDWEHQSADTIQWAPFYSDCEHEIKTITHGERITLTYNLYITTGPLDTVNPSTSILDPKTLPLYQEIKNVLEMPGFLKTGGVLGSFCTHAYPHTADNATTLLPRGLKGADLVLYSVFDSLGIEVEMLPVIIGSGENDYYYGSSSNDDGSSSNDYSSSNDKHGSDDDYYTYAKLDEKVHIGLWLEPHFSADNWEDDPVSQVLEEYWTETTFEKPVTWITYPRGANLQEAMDYKTYGNEPTMSTLYSYAAILAIIPPWAERQKRVGKDENE